jgi:hypothetical protein
MVGTCLRALAADGFSPRVATKAHPSQPGGLSPRGLEAQLEASLQAMGVNKVSGGVPLCPAFSNELARQARAHRGTRNFRL